MLVLDIGVMFPVCSIHPNPTALSQRKSNINSYSCTIMVQPERLTATSHAIILTSFVCC